MDSSHLGGYPSQPLDSLSGAKLDQQIRQGLKIYGFIETKRTLFDLERDSSEDMMGCDIIHELGSIGQRRQGNPRTASCFPCYRCYSSARTRTSDQT